MHDIEVVRADPGAPFQWNWVSRPLKDPRTDVRRKVLPLCKMKLPRRLAVPVPEPFSGKLKILGISRVDNHETE
jgi:hypothetical protein